MSKFIYFCIRGSLRWNIVISSIVIIMFALVLIPSVASIDSEYKFPVSIKINEFNPDDIDIIPIEASNHYDYGKKAVEKNKGVFVGLTYLSSLDKYDDYKNYCEDNIYAWENDAENRYNDFLDEFKGIRDAIKELFKYASENIKDLFKIDELNLERVLYMGILLADLSIIFDICTTTGATDDATDSGDATFIHQNIDNNLGLRGDLYWLYLSKTINVAKIDGEYNYAFWGFPVIGEWPFLNEKDVGFVGNALRLSETRNVNTSDELTDMPSIWLQKRSMMECDRVVDPVGQDLSDVKDLWEDADRASGRDNTYPHDYDDQNMIWCDGFSNIITIEQMHDFFITKIAGTLDTSPIYPDILACTNHHQWLDPDDTGSIKIPDEDKKHPESEGRLARAYELLKNKYGNLDADYFENDIAWWTGFTKNDVREIIKKNSRNIVHIKINGLDDDYIIFSSDEKKFKSIKKPIKPVVNLLPGLDPYMMGYKDRQRYLNYKYYDYIFDRGGNATTTILLNGQVIGIWDFIEPTIKIFLFEPMKENTIKQIHSNAKRIGEFISREKVEIKECRSMSPLTKRTAGSVMSPLKDD